MTSSATTLHTSKLLRTLIFFGLGLIAGIWITSETSSATSSDPTDSNYITIIRSNVTNTHNYNKLPNENKITQSNFLNENNVKVDENDNMSENEPISEECDCDGENFCFQSYVDGKKTSKGIRFNCKLVPYLRRFGLDSKTKLEEVKMFNANNVVIVTYASSNHFAESRLAVKKIRSIMNNTIAYYDVGLRQHEVNELKSVCNLVYHKVNFSEFPSHTRHLHNYAFKPIIDAMAFKTYKVYWYVDASVRFRQLPKLLEFYQYLQTNHSYDLDQVMNAIRTTHSQYFATHSGMHLFFPQNNDLAKKTRMHAAGIQFVRRGIHSQEVMKWYLMCALDQYCMAPKHASQGCRNLKKDPMNLYGHCHRFDQSALGAIKMSIFSREGHHRISNLAWNKFISVERSTRLNNRITNLACPLVK